VVPPVLEAPSVGWMGRGGGTSRRACEQPKCGKAEASFWERVRNGISRVYRSAENA